MGCPMVSHHFPPILPKRDSAHSSIFSISLSNNHAENVETKRLLWVVSSNLSYYCEWKGSQDIVAKKVNRYTIRGYEQMMKKMTKEEGKSRMVESIPIDLIAPNPYQPRKTFSETSLEELARSIRRYGLIQPISIRRKKEGTFELIAGERRLRASKKAGFTHINAIVYEMGEEESAVIALIENLQRENLHFFDEAEAYRNLLLEHGLTQEELARRIGKNQSTVANKLRTLRLSPRVREAISANRLTERHARTLLRIQEEGLSVKSTEDLVEKILDKLYQEEEPAKRKKRMVGILRDGRLVMNSVQKLVEQLEEIGLDADYTIQDQGDRYEVRMVINKQTQEQMKSAI